MSLSSPSLVISREFVSKIHELPLDDSFDQLPPMTKNRALDATKTHHFSIATLALL